MTTVYSLSYFMKPKINYIVVMLLVDQINDRCDMESLLGTWGPIEFHQIRSTQSHIHPSKVAKRGCLI